jgi:telomerase reverse transcriptase
VRTLKEPVWCRLQSLLGQGGDRLIMDMLIDCALFMPVEGAGNYYQLSGMPISDLKPEKKPKEASERDKNNQPTKGTPLNQCEDRSASTITFVRSRMLYAKAALNAKGGVRFGMRHIR